MLIEVPFKDGDVVTLKMLGGDELVAKLVETTNNRTYKLKHILVVMMAQSGFGLMPFMMTVEHSATHEIDMKNVIAIHKTHKEVASQYIKQTTGIVI